MTKYNCIDTLIKAGISYQDATALRRISMTLHRWHELECGNGNDHGSWCITRGDYVRTEGPTRIPASDRASSPPKMAFKHDDDGKPFLEHHHYRHGNGKDSTSYSPMPDRERGALKRLAKIMANYPGWASYVQGDPRGCALYILRPDDVPTEKLYRRLPDGSMIRDVDAISSYYTRGIAVYK